METSKFADQIALIRFSILIDYENRGDVFSSKGISSPGNLDYVFPRTYKIAAINHASMIVSKLFDERIRDKGYHHIFRLPSNYEGQIHEALMNGQIFNTIDQNDGEAIITTVTKVKPDSSKALEGPQNMGSINLLELKSIKKIGVLHSDAMAAQKIVIPYFDLK